MYVFDQLIGIMTNMFPNKISASKFPRLTPSPAGRAGEGFSLPQLLPQIDQHILCHRIEVIFRLPSPLLAGAGVVEAVGP